LARAPADGEFAAQFAILPAWELAAANPHDFAALWIPRESKRSFPGRLLAGTLDPDCHAGFGAETTRPLLWAILAWIRDFQMTAVEARPSYAS